jgi:hypothetical protein
MCDGCLAPSPIHWQATPLDSVEMSYADLDCSTPPVKACPVGTQFVRQSKAMASVRKPVIVRKFSRDWCAGYAGASFGHEAADLEILDLTGKVMRIAWDQVKWVCYVRDFPACDTTNPERLLHKRFSTRPRSAGLWIRMTLTDGEELEGLAANDLTLVEGAGLLLTPPDTRSNTQRIYVPRNAIQTLEVVGLIGISSRKRSNLSGQKIEQPNLFSPPASPEEMKLSPGDRT